eukprot:jgi/Ulvmu1/2355/UM013_0203.1
MSSRRGQVLSWFSSIPGSRAWPWPPSGSRVSCAAGGISVISIRSPVCEVANERCLHLHEMKTCGISVFPAPAVSSRCNRATHVGTPTFKVVWPTMNASQRLPRTMSAAAEVAEKSRPAPRPSTRRLQATVRGSAVISLLRIEQDGAYVALLSRSSSSQGHPPSQENGSHRQRSVPPEGQANAPASQQSNSQGREAREATWLVSGVTRWRRQLDVIISNLIERSVDDLDAAVRQILRMAVFEVVHSDLADHAISAHVELCSVAGHSRAAGLVNAALRRLVRARAEGSLDALIPQLPTPYDGDAPEGRKALRQRARAVAIATSHPTWLVSRWLKQLGEQATVALCQHNNRAAPEYGVRVNTRRASVAALQRRLEEAGADVQRSALLPADFLRVTRGMQAVLRCGCLEEGTASVQDEAAGLVVAAALRPLPHSTLLDTCAAPGGKALAAAAGMRSAARAAQRGGEGPGADEEPSAGLVVAADSSGARLRLVGRAAELWELQGAVVTVAGDLRERASSRGFDMHGVSHPGLETSAGQPWQFDAVLVDAPCSGTGVLCKRADMRWKRSAQHVAELVELQRELLAAALRCVLPGGVLVYSTCSLEAEENEQQVEWLLAQFPGVLRVERITAADLEAAGVPAGGAGGASTVVAGAHAGSGILTGRGFLRCLPHVHGCDGSFAARLRVVAQLGSAEAEGGTAQTGKGTAQLPV